MNDPPPIRLDPIDSDAIRDTLLALEVAIGSLRDALDRSPPLRKPIIAGAIALRAAWNLNQHTLPN